jgi:spore maturation protein CgeB
VFADIKRATRGPMVSWWVDDPWVYPESVANLPLFDCVFTFDRAYLASLTAAGVARAAFLPCAADETVYAPQVLPAAVRRRLETDVAFVASYYPGRAALARTVAERTRVGVWGIGWRSPGATDEFGGLDLVRGGIRGAHEAARIYSATKVGLNVHHRHSRLGGVNTRTFELLASGTVPLVDRLPGLEELLEPRREVVCYDTAEEARDAAAALVADERARAAIALRGRARVLADHTFVARMREVLRTVDA